MVRVKKTFESCGVRLKLCRMYSNVFLSCCFTHVAWIVRIEEFSKRINRLKRNVRRIN